MCALTTRIGDTSEWQTIPVFVVFETIAEAARVMTELVSPFLLCLGLADIDVM